MRHSGIWLAGSLALAVSLTPGAAHAGDDRLTLEKIMQHPDWMGNAPQGAYWSDDGTSVYYRQKRRGEEIDDLYRLALGTGDRKKLAPAELADADAPADDWRTDYSGKVFERHGDIFFKDTESGLLRQITRSSRREHKPFFMAGGTDIGYHAGDSVFIYDLNTGQTSEVADLRLEKAPDSGEEFDFLRRQHLRLIDQLTEDKSREDNQRKHGEKLRAEDPSRVDTPYYLGDDVKVAWKSLSPAGDMLVVGTEPKDYDGGRAGSMPDYITESGYVKMNEVRTRVGRNPPPGQNVLLIDLEKHEVRKLDLSQLDDIDEDPLAELREKALEWHVDQGGADRKSVKKAIEAPEQRPVRVEGIKWNDSGTEVALQFHSVDNKDRWLATVDWATNAPVVQHRLHDPAWINWNFNEFGWLPDDRTLWYLSEETGYSHLYTKRIDGRRRQLTEGEWVVYPPELTRDGETFYFAGNREHPGQFDVYRVPASGGTVERVTQLGNATGHEVYSNSAMAGNNGFELSPDGGRLLLAHSTPSRHPELYVKEIGDDASAHRLTNTVSDAYAAVEWNSPEIVKVPSRHVDRPIHARVYTPDDFDPSKSYPAVMFIHGAGYLQNAHKGWSVYFHEFMFHSLLTRHGYVVMDMDYRASEGYGRDWRTAIYRRMGHPEVEDLADGVKWLADNRAVDPDRVGVYGGSYGGFLTFMAMFREPDLFAAGAGLRPVTNWAHYNHPYTSNILNTPAVDPAAYKRSSPLEFVEGLKNPLILSAGMQDDNVFFQDTVLLTQRLIELKKEDWWLHVDPMGGHGFDEPESWLDGYRRIFNLFERYLKKDD